MINTFCQEKVFVMIDKKICGVAEYPFEQGSVRKFDLSPHRGRDRVGIRQVWQHADGPWTFREHLELELRRETLGPACSQPHSRSCRPRGEGGDGSSDEMLVDLLDDAYEHLSGL